VTRVEKIAKVEETMLGVEDHGILTATLHVTYGGSGQGIGGYALDNPDPDMGDSADTRRIGTAYGMEWIARCIRACGVDRWERIKGRTIIVLFESERFGARPIGIAPLPTEPGAPFIFADLTREFYPELA
jgi:hypothetical protein